MHSRVRNLIIAARRSAATTVVKATSGSKASHVITPVATRLATTPPQLRQASVRLFGVELRPAQILYQSSIDKIENEYNCAIAREKHYRDEAYKKADSGCWSRDSVSFVYDSKIHRLENEKTAVLARMQLQKQEEKEKKEREQQEKREQSKQYRGPSSSR
jgi:hypothetical protein